MTTLLLDHPTCELHDMGRFHPECPSRLAAIRRAVDATDWQGRLRREHAPALAMEQLYRVHPKAHVDALLALSPADGMASIDGDTLLNAHSIAAALHAAGSGCLAVDRVIDGNVRNAFCAVRPPGHHAETAIAMGFCLFNNIAVAAEHALARGAQRVAILDFDVHHGNGTVEIFRQRPEVMVCSSFQHPFYPGRYDTVKAPNIVLTPLQAGTGGDEFRRRVERDWVAALQAHRPDMVLVSAGFDAHRDDPLGGLALIDDDYAWLTALIVDQADDLCDGRLVSRLEGGYDLGALARCVTLHLKVLCGLNGNPGS